MLDGILAAVIVGVLAFILGYVLRKFIWDTKVGNANVLAESVIEEAHKEAEALKKEAGIAAREEAHREREKLQGEIKEQRQELTNQERKLDRREETLDNRAEGLDKRTKEIQQTEQNLLKRDKTLEAKEIEVSTILDEQKKMLEKVAGLSKDEAKRILLDKLQEDVVKESGLIIKRVQEETKAIAARRAREILTTAIQRIVTDHVSDVTVSSVALPSDDIKGRIIGREGRNIRAFEAITGVNLIIDDTPDTVVLSAFDPIRREMARMTLDKLVTDGRIHPGRIEEVYAKAQKDIEELIIESGESAAFEAGVTDLKPELIKCLGRLRYRTSFGQNVLKHSVEVAHLCGSMAAELGANVKLARRAGLLHDIGKAMDYDASGTHALTAAEFCRRQGEPDSVVDAVASHHEEREPNSVEAWLVLVGDAVSASRPGARRETIETYIRRLESLENIAKSFPGVDKTYAIHAGREIRILVEPEEVDDLEAIKLARDISLKVENEMEYPGQIRVTVIRETRAVEYAK